MCKKVLTVDDSKTLRMIISRYLVPFGVEILEAENGSIGLSKAQADRPDLILLDYNMPVLDGYQTLEALKANPVLKNIPVIMLTTETVREIVVKLIKLGLKDYIAKPFSRDALLAKVNPVLALYEGDVVPEVAVCLDKAPQPKAPEVAGKKTILAVDDKENVLALLTEFLHRDFNVLTVSNGQSAVAMIPSTSFELLLLDLDMPDLSGLAVYKLVKNSLDSRRIKVAGMALRTAQAEVNNAKQVGIKEFLYKPFTKSDIGALFATLGINSAFAPGDGSSRSFLIAAGSARILSFPEEDDPTLKVFANALGTEIPKQLRDMAEEGVNRLVIKLTPAVAADFAIVKRFLALIELVETLTLSVRLVAGNEKTRAKLQRFSETAKMQTFDSLELALKSFD